MGREDKEGKREYFPSYLKDKNTLLIHKLFNMDRGESCFRKAWETFYKCRNWRKIISAFTFWQQNWSHPFWFPDVPFTQNTTESIAVGNLELQSGNSTCAISAGSYKSGQGLQCATDLDFAKKKSSSICMCVHVHLLLGSTTNGNTNTCIYVLNHKIVQYELQTNCHSSAKEEFTIQVILPYISTQW